MLNRKKCSIIMLNRIPKFQYPRVVDYYLHNGYLSIFRQIRLIIYILYKRSK